MHRTFALCCAIFFLGVGSRPVVSLGPVLGAPDWISGAATEASLRGRVVIVDVFTVDCINCRNVVPTLRALYRIDRARGLAIVGVHSPETPGEKQRAYVVENLHQQGVVWPVAVDNSFKLWKDYGVEAWPTQLFFDRHGLLRKMIVGDSQDAEVKATVESLLTEH